MSKGIVVDHKESGVRYAISEHNFNEKVHTRVRDLKPGETVLGFSPKGKIDLATDAAAGTSPEPEDDQIAALVEEFSREELAEQADLLTLPTSGSKHELAARIVAAHQTEGSSSEGTKDDK